MRFKDEFGPMEPLPTRLYLTGPEIGEQFQVEIEKGKILNITILAIGELLPDGQREVFCEMNGQLRAVFITDKTGVEVWLSRKNAQVVTDLKTSCNKVVVKPISGCVRTACSQLLRHDWNKLLSPCYN
jgi:pyruvate carboxylase